MIVRDHAVVELVEALNLSEEDASWIWEWVATIERRERIEDFGYAKDVGDTSSAVRESLDTAFLSELLAEARNESNAPAPLIADLEEAIKNRSKS
jgi:hypothetical protein